MAQMSYRGNLSARVFPFLSSQFGRSVISSGLDHVTAFGDAGGDNNIPQAYYMHNVIPTSHGYKSIGYKSVIPSAGVTFTQVMPTRDNNMVRGLIGVTDTGKVYMYRAGDATWTNVTAQITTWAGGAASIATAGGYTYLCLANNGVYKLSVANNTLAAVQFTGIVMIGIVAITSRANYLILTDGTTIYWSSTVSVEDFVPSLTTGAGSGKVSDAEGLIVALAPLGNGFAVYTAVNVVVASYSQNARYPWIFTRADNSKGIAAIQHVTSNGDDGNNYVWTSAGLQKISLAGAVNVISEVTDFLAGREFEDYDSILDIFNTQYLNNPMIVSVAFIASRYLVVSYGITSLTHALVYDTALKRWGKLKLKHTVCFEFTLNSDYSLTSSYSASVKRTLGFVTDAGEIVICDFGNAANANDSVLVLGKFQLIRSRVATFDKLIVESVDRDSNFNVKLLTTQDGKTLLTPLTLTASHVGNKLQEFPARVTGINHSVVLKGRFNLNSFEINMHLNGRR